MLISLKNLFILHIVISFVYYMYVRLKTGNNTQSLSEGAIVLAMPLFGVVFLAGIRLAQWLNASGERAQVDIYHQHSGGQLIFGEHEQYGDDIISLNDVLMMDDAGQKRALLTDAVKHNVLHNQKLLRKAIRDGDREVSHYAVSMATTMIEDVEKRLFELNKKIEKDPADSAVLSDYVNTMAEYLKVSFLDETSRRKTEGEYAGALERLLEYYPDDPGIFADKINFEICFGDYNKAEQYCRLFEQKFPLLEEQFIAYIKLYQATHDYEKFRGKIDELKRCPIQLSPRALSIIRFWELGENYV